MKDFLRKNGLILAFAVGKFGLHYALYHPAYELHRDEYLYLDQANHLAWGFLEVPPAISIQAYVAQAMGNSFFWVKFWPVLFGALTVWLTGRIVIELGGGRFAQALACLSVLVSSY
ncbi:MAG: glycosyl transferase, partial [Ferruginibacter sp.]|nr:glycosyl transferase [Cytophagales bacterium]